MPFKKSGSDDAADENFHEFRHGPRFAKLARRYGIGKARRVMKAAVLSNQRRHRHGAHRPRHRRRTGRTRAR